MYRTSQSVRILSAALAAVLGLGLVATAGGALREHRAFPKAESMKVVHLKPVVVRLHPQPQVAAACEQAPKAAL